MFVVIEWNQASHQPRVFGNEVYQDPDDARTVCEQATADAAPRREQYTVHQLGGEIDLAQVPE